MAALIGYILGNFHKPVGGGQCPEGVACVTTTPAFTPTMNSGPTLGPTVTLTGKFYYVSTGGNDASPGTDAQPYGTIGKAASVAEAGDTVLIRSGTYYEDVKPLNSGAPGQYITYKNYGDGEVIIDAQNGLRAGCIEINDKSYLQFTGLTVRGANSLYHVAEGGNRCDRRLKQYHPGQHHSLWELFRHYGLRRDHAG